jgi:TolA-binding protein
VVPPPPDIEVEEENVKPLAPVPAAKVVFNKKQDTSDPAVKIYELVISKCQKAQDPSKEIALLLNKYKDSPFTNNALFYYANSLFEKGNFTKSAEQFERLYTLFPDGNKAVPALYKLAQCYQKLGHPTEAQEAFQNIVSLYPGSREALEAEKQIMGGTK